MPDYQRTNINANLFEVTLKGNVKFIGFREKFANGMLGDWILKDTNHCKVAHAKYSSDLMDRLRAGAFED